MKSAITGIGLVANMILAGCAITEKSPSGINLSTFNEVKRKADAGDPVAKSDFALFLIEDSYALAAEALNYASAADEQGNARGKSREKLARNMCDAYLRNAQ